MPERLRVSRKGRFEKYSLLTGDRSLPSGTGSGRITVSGSIPGEKRGSTLCTPSEAARLLTAWLDGGSLLHLAVDGLPVDESVYIEEMALAYAGGFGDCGYEITFLIVQGVQSGQRTYTVRQGDTLWSIARKTLGGGEYADLLRNANRAALEESGGLRAGMLLAIPEVKK